jgi:integrase
MADGPLCPGANGTPYTPYNTAYSRFSRLTEKLGITGAHTHMLRHQFATEALATDPRELANISQVLGHENVETTLRFYINPRELHQPGEKLQVSRSRDRRNGVPPVSMPVL